MPIRIIIFLIGISLMSYSCNYERTVGCNLDEMKVHGNVTKIETLSLTNIPLTEIYSSICDINYSTTTYMGNVVIEFDKYGNIKRHEGYGVDGYKLYEKQFDEKVEVPILPIILGLNVEKVKVIKDPKGEIVNTKYYENNIEYNLRIKYNKNGEPIEIIRTIGDLDFMSDTTTYEYSNFDQCGNWRELNVRNKSAIKTNNYNYSVLRQITYNGEAIPTPLMSRFKDLTFCDKSHQKSKMSSISLGEYGEMLIPDYMKIQSDEYIERVNIFNSNIPKMDYCFSSNYNGDDNYAVIYAVNVPSSIDYSTYFTDDSSYNKYNKEFDDACKAQYDAMSNISNIYILKWLPYEFVEISGKKALKLSYYRQANPIPIYCEVYSIPINNESTLGITCAFQSNMYDKFYEDFSVAISSVKIYQ